MVTYIGVDGWGNVYFSDEVGDRVRKIEGVCTAPVITTQPAGSIVCSGNEGQFSVEVKGYKLAYQWQVDTGSGFADLSDNGTYVGSASPTLSIASSSASMNGYVYRCIVTSGTCTTTSGAATLTVNPTPPAPELLGTTAVQGPYSVVLLASNCNGTLVWSGASSGSGSSLVVSAATVGTFTYSVRCQTDFCLSEASSVSVTVVPRLTASALASPSAILTNQSSTLTASVAGGTAPYTYEWSGPGTIANGNTASATVSGLTSGLKTFTVTITDASPDPQVITKTVQVSVTQANHAPVATTIPAQNATVGVGYSLDLATYFSDADNDVLTYTAAGLPEGLQLEEGYLVGMPITAGAGTVTVKATDPGNLTATVSFTFTVAQGQFRMLTPDYNCGTGSLRIQTIGGNGNPIEYEIPSVSKGWVSESTFLIEAKKLDKELKLRARQRLADGKKYDEVEINFTPSACSSSPLVMLTPVFNCKTAQLTVKTQGGNGNPIEYNIPSITKGWETLTTYIVEAKKLGKEVKVKARQRNIDGKKYDDVEVKFTPRACGTEGSRLGVPESEVVSELTLTVLGNPVSDVVKFEVRGVEGQPVQLRLMDMQGRIIEARSIQSATEVEEHTFDVQRQASVMLLLQATTPNQQKVVKVLKR